MTLKAWLLHNYRRMMSITLTQELPTAQFGVKKLGLHPHVGTGCWKTHEWFTEHDQHREHASVKKSTLARIWG